MTGEVYEDWEAVYRDNIGRVYALMFGKVGNRADAEDLTAEVFVTALRPLLLPSPVAGVRAYLQATSRTVLARYWRRKLGLQLTELVGDHPGEMTTADAGSQAVGKADRILAALPDRYRRILQLRFIEACSIAEAAKALGVSVANAKVLQHRALRRAADVAAGLEAG
ncbi:MAG TPA: RNA polymerase sigma factor [Streptosporangiaceae bacterium]